MQNDHFAVIRMQKADPTINWPKLGSAETKLCERDGWHRCDIPVLTVDGKTHIESMTRGQLAVHLMLGEDEGFAIALSDTGWRISYGGSVFARCNDAMVAAEAMLENCPDWIEVRRRGFNDHHRQVLKEIITAAEKRGEIMPLRVFPS